MKSMKIILTALALVLLFAGSVSAKSCKKACDSPSCTTCHPKKDSGTQTSCPVMGGEIDSTIYADYKGERVYFCCKGCIETFNKDPKTYLQKMSDAGQKPAKATK